MLASLKFNLFLALLLHIAAFSFVGRVGFAVPLPRHGAQFFYGGSMAFPNAMAEPSVLEERSTQPAGALKDTDAAFFLPWMQMRQLNKPRL